LSRRPQLDCGRYRASRTDIRSKIASAAVYLEGTSTFVMRGSSGGLRLQDDVRATQVARASVGMKCWAWAQIDCLTLVMLREVNGVVRVPETNFRDRRATCSVRSHIPTPQSPSASPLQLYGHSLSRLPANLHKIRGQDVSLRRRHGLGRRSSHQPCAVPPSGHACFAQGVR
jgi:hypothetical protein